MEKYSIEIFMPLVNEGVSMEAASHFVALPAVSNVWLWSAAAYTGELPGKMSVLEVRSLTATSVFRDMAERATADYVLYLAKDGVSFDAVKLSSMIQQLPADAAMAYSDYYKIIDGAKCEAPVIDYQAGSLRNDFDFGSLVLFRTSALKAWLAEICGEYSFAGSYQLRLAMSRLGSLYHHKEFLYTEQE